MLPFNILSADAEWFTFSSTKGNFSVYAFSGWEEVCRPYEFVIELVSRSAEEDISGLLGTEACLSIIDVAIKPLLLCSPCFS